MFRLYLLVPLLLAGAQLHAQRPTTTDPYSEGRLLYRLELASWHSTDLLKGQGATEDTSYGGYFSYETGKQVKSVYFSKGDSARVLATISFDTTLDLKQATVDKTSRAFTEQERNLYEIRNAALAALENRKYFKRYEYTSFNIIPLINERRRVFVMTAPTQSNEVLFGNDYLLFFDNDNKLVSKQRIHRSLLRFPAKSNSKDPANEISTTYHTHLPSTGDMFTATDICTLLLYGRMTEWKSHMVVGSRGTYVWKIETGKVESGK